MNREALKKAVDAVQRLLMEGEGEELRGMGKSSGPEVEIEVEPGGECEACAAGECTDPEHLGDEDAEAMAAEYGVKG